MPAEQRVRGRPSAGSVGVRTYAELVEQVKACGCVAEVDIGTLHEMEGAQRQGTYVRSSITQSLASHGLDHFPQQLPSYGHETIRVYLRDSRVGRVIDAVLRPSSGGDAELNALARRESRGAPGH